MIKAEDTLIKDMDQWRPTIESIVRVTTQENINKVYNPRADEEEKGFEEYAQLITNNLTIIKIIFRGNGKADFAIIPNKLVCAQIGLNPGEIVKTVTPILANVLIGNIYYDYPDSFYKVVSLCFNTLYQGDPLNMELLMSRATVLGIPKNHLLSFNMIYRTLLYKLKKLRFRVMTDDEEWDNKVNLNKVITSTKKIKPYVSDMLRSVVDAHLKINNGDSDSDYLNASVTTRIRYMITDIYSTTNLNLMDHEEFYRRFKEEVDAHNSHFKSPIEGTIITLRHIMFEVPIERERLNARKNNLPFEVKKPGVVYENTTDYKPNIITTKK